MNVRQLSINVIIVGAATIAGQVTGMLREVVFAYLLGASALSDSFVVAYAPFDIILSTLALALPFSLVPFILSQKANDPDADCYVGIYWGMGIAGALVGLIVALGARPLVLLMAPGLEPHSVSVAIVLMRIMSVAIPLSALASALTAYFFLRNRMLLPSIRPFLLNVGLTVVPLASWRYWGVKGLAIGAVAGVLAYLFLQQIAFSIRVRLRWRMAASDWRIAGQALACAAPVIAYLVLGNLNMLIARRSVSHLGTGSIAALGYAWRLVNIAYVLAAAVTTYPHFSSFALAVSKGDLGEARNLLRSMLRTGWAIVFPFVAVVAVLARPIVAHLFQRGAFDQAATRLTVHALLFLLPSLLPAIVVDVCARCMIALHGVWTVVKLVILQAIIAYVLVLIGAHWFGFAGVLAGFTLSVFVAAALLSSACLARLQPYSERSTWFFLAKTAGCSLVLALVIAALYRVLSENRIGTDLVNCALAAAVGCLLYWIAAKRLGVNDLAHTLSAGLERRACEGL